MNRNKIHITVIIGLVIVLGCVAGSRYLRFSSASLLDQPIQDQSSAKFAILAGAGITNTGATTVSGDIGSYPTLTQTGIDAGADAVTLTGDNHFGDSVTQLAKTDLVTAYNDAVGRTPTITYDPAKNLGGLTLAPGVYKDPISFAVTGTLTLDAMNNPNAVWIFQSGSTLVTAAGAPGNPGSVISLINGAQGCNVFWQVGSSATINPYSDFVGNILAMQSISLKTGASVKGRVLARNGAVTLDTNTITATNCAVISTTAILKVVKHVDNTGGGHAIASDFRMHIEGQDASSAAFDGSETGVNVTLSAGHYAVTETGGSADYIQTVSTGCSGTIVAGVNQECTITNTYSPATPTATLHVVKAVVGGPKSGPLDFPPLFIDGVQVVSGAANILATGSHTVTENIDPNYTQKFSDNCADGHITLASDDDSTCTITNTYDTPSSSSSSSSSGSSARRVAPLIDVVKVPSPLSLPDGPGSVNYSYTLRNIGTVSVTDIKMIDDSCSSVNLVSGDSDSDTKLDVSEVWTYRCSVRLSATHTNTVVATGWANGVSATDIASATVIVGAPVVPPLIHVTKIPSPLALSAGGGTVLFTEKITNPGTVALSNVQINDDKCVPVKYISGDINSDLRLDPSETWTYTCQADLLATTTNTVTVSGRANNMTARDFAIVTVIVETPKLPNTGYSPNADKKQ